LIQQSNRYWVDILVGPTYPWCIPIGRQE